MKNGFSWSVLDSAFEVDVFAVDLEWSSLGLSEMPLIPDAWTILSGANQIFGWLCLHLLQEQLPLMEQSREGKDLMMWKSEGAEKFEMN